MIIIKFFYFILFYFIVKGKYLSQTKKKTPNIKEDLSRIDQEEELLDLNEGNFIKKKKYKSISDVSKNINNEVVQIVKNFLQPAVVGLIEPFKYDNKISKLSLSTSYITIPDMNQVSRAIIMEILFPFDKRLKNYFSRYQPIRINLVMLPIFTNFQILFYKRIYIYINYLSNDTLSSYGFDKVSLILSKSNSFNAAVNKYKLFCGMHRNFKINAEYRFVTITFKNYNYFKTSFPLKIKILSWFDYNEAFIQNLEQLSFIKLLLYQPKLNRLHKMKANYIYNARNVTSQNENLFEFFSNWFITPMNDPRLTDISNIYIKSSELGTSVLNKKKYLNQVVRTQIRLDDRLVASTSMDEVSFETITGLAVQSSKKKPKKKLVTELSTIKQLFIFSKQWVNKNFLL